MHYRAPLFYFLVLACMTSSCSGSRQINEDKTGQTAQSAEPNFSLEYSIEEAPEWTNLFYRKSGWFGADGIFSIGLDGNDINQNGQEETLIIFSDTYIGEVENNAPLPGNTMVNNSVAYKKGLGTSKDDITFHYHQSPDKNPTSFFEPPSQTGHKQHYWLGDGFVNVAQEDRLYIFAYHVEVTGPNVFDFREPNVSLLSIPANSRPPFAGQQHLSTPLHIEHETLGEGNFGAGIFANTSWNKAPSPDGYIYVYACIGEKKSLVCARVLAEDFDRFKKWRYWDGTKWNKDIKSLQGITDAVSNELSVTAMEDGRYLLVFQVLGISDKVGLRVGASPIGPFGPIEEIYRTPEIDQGLLPYNAKAHPALSGPGELLISYNTITFDFWKDIQKDAHIYRPRFIKLIFGNH